MQCKHGPMQDFLQTTFLLRILKGVVQPKLWQKCIHIQAIYIYIYAFSRRFYPKQYNTFRLYIFCQYVCTLGIEPTTFALLTQCSTTEPQEHTVLRTHNIKYVDEFVSSSEQIWRNVALHHLLTSESSAVNGCRQNESPNS